MARTSLLVLAAGMGNRFGGLKQMAAVGPRGETLIDYSLYDARRACFEKVVFVIRKAFASEFQKSVGRSFERHFEVCYAFQELEHLPEAFTVPANREKPWGTAHAILCAEEALQEPFAVINGDDLYGPEAFVDMAKFLAVPGNDYALVGYHLAQTLSTNGTVARGICAVDAYGYLRTIEECTQIERRGSLLADFSGALPRPLPEATLVSMNFWGFRPALFTDLGRHFESFLAQRGGDPKAECYISSTVGLLLNQGKAKVRVLKTGSQWNGVTYREDLPETQAFVRGQIRSGIYPEGGLL